MVFTHPNGTEEILWVHPNIPSKTLIIGDCPKTAHVLLISGDVLKDPTKPISGNPFLPYEKPTGPGNIR